LRKQKTNKEREVKRKSARNVYIYIYSKK